MSSPGSLPFAAADQLLLWADAIASVPADGGSPSWIRSLRSRIGADAAAWVLALASQQRRAVEKFGVGVWMATEKSIAQATDRRVARYKAGWMDDRPVWDLCGGIGGDAMELARRGPLVTIDADRQISAMAAANLILDGRSQGEAIWADVTRYAIPPAVAIHVDPDRRPTGVAGGRRGGTAAGRVVAPQRYQPPLDQVAQWVAGQRSGSPAGGGCVPDAVIKLAPAADLDEPIAAGWFGPQLHRQWISVDGSVREQVLLCGERLLARAGVVAGQRSAVRLMNDGTVQRWAAWGTEVAAEADRPLAFLLDVDPAVRAAGLSAAIAAHHGWRTLGSPAGFFTADSPPAARDLVQCFTVLWSGAADAKRLRQLFASEGWWLESVKVRAAGHEPQQWMRQLRAKSSAKSPRAPQVTLLIGRHGRGHYAVVGQRLVGI